MAELGEHPPDLAIAPFLDGDLQDALVAQPLDDFDAASAGAESFAALGIRQPHAALHFFDHARRHEPVDDRPIRLGHPVARVCQLIGQLAVVGEQK